MAMNKIQDGSLQRFTLSQCSLQCESKKSPLVFSDVFYQTVRNFWAKFYVPIVRSNLRWTTTFY